MSQPQQQQQPQPRRVPPPCWTHEEIGVLIDSYHHKWYSLHRGHLKASHWIEVAEAIAQRCPNVTLSKTSVQCRHKIEKLRQRYRAEKQRATALVASNGRYKSNWVYFKKMDIMERGTSAATSSDDDDGVGDGGDDEPPIRMVSNADLHPPPPPVTVSNGRERLRFRVPSRIRSTPSSYSMNYGKIPSFNNTPSLNPMSFGEIPSFKTPPEFSSNPNLRYGKSSSCRPMPRPTMERNGGRDEGVMDPVAEMVASIRMLGEGYMRMEEKKIEALREIMRMQIEMEIQRTEIFCQAQQQIAEAFTNGMSGKKRVKRMLTPDG